MARRRQGWHPDAHSASGRASRGVRNSGELYRARNYSHRANDFVDTRCAKEGDGRESPNQTARYARRRRPSRRFPRLFSVGMDHRTDNGCVRRLSYVDVTARRRTESIPSSPAWALTRISCCDGRADYPVASERLRALHRWDSSPYPDLVVLRTCPAPRVWPAPPELLRRELTRASCQCFYWACLVPHLHRSVRFGSVSLFPGRGFPLAPAPRLPLVLASSRS
jgi:hypothetical protein